VAPVLDGEPVELVRVDGLETAVGLPSIARTDSGFAVTWIGPIPEGSDAGQAEPRTSHRLMLRELGPLLCDAPPGTAEGDGG
jgi:hypothetical protein